MRLSTFTLLMATCLISSVIHAKDHVKAFDYQIPKALSELCQARIDQLPAKNKAHHQDGCMYVNIQLAHTPYPILNDAINQDINADLVAELNDTARHITEYLSEPTNHQLNHHQQIREIDIVSHSPTLWQVSVSDYVYLGGAHGMPTMHFYSYDVQRRQVLKLHDVLTTKNKKPQLEKLVKAAYLQHLKRSYADEKDIINHLNNWKFYLNENFYLTPQGITFTYAPYELGPYASGFTILNIPKYKLTGIIKPHYLKADLGSFDDHGWHQEN